MEALYQIEIGFLQVFHSFSQFFAVFHSFSQPAVGQNIFVFLLKLPRRGGRPREIEILRVREADLGHSDVRFGFLGQNSSGYHRSDAIFDVNSPSYGTVKKRSLF